MVRITYIIWNGHLVGSGLSRSINPWKTREPISKASRWIHKANDQNVAPMLEIGLPPVPAGVHLSTCFLFVLLWKTGQIRATFHRAAPHVAHLCRPSLDIAGPTEACLMQCSHTRGRCTGGEGESLVLRTSEALVAWRDVEGARLHGQLVELGELRRDGSRGRLWEGERRGGRRRERTGRREGSGRGRTGRRERGGRGRTSTLVNTETPTRNNTSHISQCRCWHPLPCHWSLRSLMPLSDQQNALTASEGHAPRRHFSEVQAGLLDHV